MNPLNPNLVSENALKEWLGYEQRQKIERWLSDRNIPFELSKSGIVTTVTAINSGLIGANEQTNSFEFD